MQDKKNCGISGLLTIAQNGVHKSPYCATVQVTCKHWNDQYTVEQIYTYIVSLIFILFFTTFYKPAGI